MSRKRALPVNTKYSGEEFDTDYDDDDRSNGQQNGLGTMPVQRNAANARERARMRVLSSAFSRLKTKLPWVPADTKLSKLDTLRLATIYIQQLRNSLATGKEIYCSPIDNIRLDANFSDNSNQTSLVWPFTFQSQTGSQPKTIQNFETESNYCSGNRVTDQHLNPWIEKEVATSQCQYWDNSSNPSTYYDKFHFKTNNVNNNNSPQSEHG